MTPEDFRKRTKAFGLRCIRLVDALPKSLIGRTLGAQLLRSGTSVGSNYRAACRAKSQADFISKMRIVEEESDESLYWMELLVESGQIRAPLLADLMKEGDAILAMVVASIKTARVRRESPISNLQSPIPNSQKE